MIRTIAVLVLAPLVFWLVGVAALSAVRADEKRLPIAPILGVLVTGWVTELAYALGGSPFLAVGVLLVAAAALVVRAPPSGRALGTELAAFAPIYLVAITVAALAPFPGLGAWSNDWRRYLEMGAAVADGGSSPEMMARPPLLSAATVPFFVVERALVTYQIVSAFVSAAAAFCLRWATRASGRPEAGIGLMAIFLASPLFLLHAAYVWPKMLAGSGLFLALVEASLHREDRKPGSWVLACAFLSLGVASHEAVVFSFPLVLALGFGRRDVRVKEVVRAVLVMGVVGLVIVGPWEILELARVGLHARIAESPSFFDRSTDPAVVRWAKVVMAELTGWMPLGVLGYFTKKAAVMHSAQATPALGFMVVSSWATTLAGTFLGVLLPLIASAPRRASLLVPREREMPRAWLLAAIAISILAMASVEPSASPWGNMQVGLSGMAMWVWWKAVMELRAVGGVAWERRALLTTVLMGAVPFVAAQASVLIALGTPRLKRLVVDAIVASDGDAATYYQDGSPSLGAIFFPVGLLVLLAMTALVITYGRSAERRAAGRMATT